MFTHVIFDLDGTLLDTLEDIADAANWVCAQRGWPVHPVPAFKRFVGNGASKLMERVTPREVFLSEQEHGQLVAEFTRRYTGHKSDKTVVYAGLPEAVEQLRQAGVTLAVLTNKPDVAAAPVVERYYPGVFTAVQGALDGVPTKPDPTLLRRLMARIGAQPEQTLFVGDSDVDIRTAKNGGLRSCGVLWGFRTGEELLGEGADALVSTAKELTELILK